MCVCVLSLFVGLFGSDILLQFINHPRCWKMYCTPFIVKPKTKCRIQLRMRVLSFVEGENGRLYSNAYTNYIYEKHEKHKNSRCILTFCLLTARTCDSIAFSEFHLPFLRLDLNQWEYVENLCESGEREIEGERERNVYSFNVRFTPPTAAWMT